MSIKQSSILVTFQVIFCYHNYLDIQWNDVVATVCPQLSRLSISALIDFTHRCLFSSETKSIMNPQFLPARQLLVDSLLGILKTTQQCNDQILLYTHIQACQSVTSQLGTDFFERHATEPVDQIVIKAYNEGLEISIIEKAISIIEPAYGVSNEKVMLSFVVGILREILESQNRSRIQQFIEVFQEVIGNWRESRENSISTLLQRILELFVEFQNSDVACPMAKLLLFLVKMLDIPKNSFLPLTTAFLIHSLAPSIVEFQNFSTFDTFTLLSDTLLSVLSSDSTDSTLSIDVLFAITEVTLEALAPVSLYSSVLSLTCTNVVRWIDGEGSLMGDVFRSNFFDIATFNLVRIVSGQQWRMPSVGMKERVCKDICFVTVSKCFEKQKFDSGLQFAFLPVFVLCCMTLICRL